MPANDAAHLEPVSLPANDAPQLERVSALSEAPKQSQPLAWLRSASRLKRWALSFLIWLAGFGILLLVWSAAATQFLEVQLPRPGLVVDAIRDNFGHAAGLELQGLQGGYASNLKYTVLNTLRAFAIASPIGFLVGMLSARLQGVRDLSAPLLLLFATVPELVAAPFLLIWFGPGEWAQGVLVGFYCFVIVAVAAQNAALRLAPEYEEFAATLGASAWRRFFTVVVPGGLPAVIGGLRIALAVSWSLQCAAELLGSDTGVGRVITLSQQLGYTAGIIAMILLVGVVAVICDRLLTGALRWIARWQESIA